MAYYTHYRMSALGDFLEDSLEDLISSDALTAEQAELVRLQFDRAISTTLSNHVRTRASLTGRLDVYRNCDNVWTFFLKSATITWLDPSPHPTTQVDSMRITAPDARQPTANRGNQ